MLEFRNEAARNGISSLEEVLGKQSVALSKLGHFTDPHATNYYSPVEVKDALHSVFKEHLADTPNIYNEAFDWIEEAGELDKATLKEIKSLTKQIEKNTRLIVDLRGQIGSDFGIKER